MQNITTDPARVAVFRALYLGDFICATPALTALRARFPQSELTLIGLPWTAGILTRFGVVDRFEMFPGFPGLPDVPYEPQQTKRFLERMRAYEFDLAIQLHGDGHISNAFIEAIGARASIGYRVSPDADRRLTHSLPWREDESEVPRWSRLVELLGARSGDKVRFPIAEAESNRAGALLGDPPSSGPYIGLHCGAKLPSRRWPVDRFAQVGNLLAQSTGASIVLTGTESERPLTSRLRERLGTTVLDLTGRTDLGTLAAVIDRLDLLITNDTGASHIAAATETPSVVLFGPSDPRRWAPLDSARHRVIDGAPNRCRRESSIGGIPVDRVVSACLSQLARAPRRDARRTETPFGTDLTWSR